jgi:ferric-dicitrate binding protein FerR (iron transport regulator)
MNCASATEDGDLLKEAEQWERAIAGGDPSTLRSFTEWIRRSPEHVQAYLAIVCLDVELTELDSALTFDLDGLID